MAILFNEFSLPRITLPNRLVVSPMCQYSGHDGFANDWHLVHLGQFAIGKAGAVIQEATAVVPEGRISFWDLGIWKDDHIEKYRQITAFIKAQGSIPGIQLAHAGRKGSDNKPWQGRAQFAPDSEYGWQTVAPSAIPFHEKDHTPIALTITEIRDLVVRFREAAERAVKAGYDIIEIHAAHGYLIHQFLSPLVNQRTDAYGGSFENRIRFLLEIVEVVAEVTTDQSLWVRISASDWADGGWDVAQSVALTNILKEKGVEVIDVSSGGAVRHQQIDVGPNYQVGFAQTIKEGTGLTTAAVGIITSGAQAEEILQKQHADLILVARAFLDDPHLAYHAAQELDVNLAWADQYARAKETIKRG
ncbi:NADH:flavin oxidoreductase/NADH oxidase [Sphingobacterium paludis]|uniref:2,4-dienoyl-CoA reductase-like NADH-dependent reductase (Old Yellow Enzyme family) n=1 Tax=Sphingobacterium paludis TaxID=1476465 RepID=A0A4R7CSC5_9SPHI|nr:NADH:flavin oxidoreductase/NADH oxidase [Sphingobacterium paludis]TDS09734.1 2,4-dienoyl-CoA reductase-like NADH-dependent reductase (Old Yellow Enzyme family) [Sphingobacterium paludis]